MIWRLVSSGKLSNSFLARSSFFVDNRGRLKIGCQGFFRQMKQEGQRRAGHPRFRGERWRTFGFSEFSGIRLVGRRLYWNTMPGGLRVRFHRALPEGKPLACSFTRTDKGWTACFQMSVETAEPRATTRPVGLDIGLTTLAALSTGERIPNLRHAKRVEREERRRQRALSRCKRGSARRAKIRQRLARLRRKVADTRATYLHQISAGLVRRFDLIAVEKLDIGGMARSALSKHIHDASWGQLRQKLAYKAARAGAQVIEVDPRNTSQTCPECGQVAVKDLKQRVHNCACGCVLDRDVAAARVILHRAVAGPGALNVTGYGVRALGNTDRQIDTLPHVG